MARKTLNARWAPMLGRAVAVLQSFGTHRAKKFNVFSRPPARKAVLAGFSPRWGPSN
jgi:hypothetical protein